MGEGGGGGGKGTQTSYLKGTRDTFRISLKEQGISLLWKGTFTLTGPLRKQWNLSIR